MEASKKALISSVEESYNLGRWSDLTITCGDDTHQVHKIIVCTRSPFFAVCCNGNFKESATGIIDLPEDDPQSVKLMIHYLYHHDYPHVTTPVSVRSEDLAIETATTQGKSGNPGISAVEEVLEPAEEPENYMVDEPLDPYDDRGYPPKPSKKKKGKAEGHRFFYEQEREPPPPEQMPGSSLLMPNLSIHAGVYALAEKFDIPLLRKLALDKFQKEVDYQWDSDDFLYATEKVFKATPAEDRGLRDIVLRTIANHPHLLRKKLAQDIIKGQELSFELLMYVLLQKRGGVMY